MTKVLVVILHLLVWDADTGSLLYSGDKEFSGFTISGDRIEDCRAWGVDYAKQLTAYYRQGFPNAFTNVDCEWYQKDAY